MSGIGSNTQMQQVTPAMHPVEKQGADTAENPGAAGAAAKSRLSDEHAVTKITTEKRSLTGKEEPNEQATALIKRFGNPQSIINQLEARMLQAEAKQLLANGTLSAEQHHNLCTATQQLDALLTEGKSLIKQYKKKLDATAKKEAPVEELAALTDEIKQKLQAVGHLWPAEIRKTVKVWTKEKE